MKFGKKHTEDSQNQAWLDWLNEESVVKPTSKPKTSTGSITTEQLRSQFKSLDGFSKRPARHVQKTATKPPVSSQTASRPAPKRRTSTESVKPLDWRASSGATTKTGQGDADVASDIAINIHLPQFHLPKITINWRYVRWAGIGVAVVALLVGGNIWLQHKNKAAELAKQSGTAQPSYAPLKPAGTDEKSLSATTKYDSKQQLYKYNDTYMGSALTVSQQPLPDDLKANPDKLKKIAEQSIQATESFDTSNGKVYIATSEGGYQRLVLMHRQLLVFITSPKELDIVDWVKYIQDLE